MLVVWAAQLFYSLQKKEARSAPSLLPAQLRDAIGASVKVSGSLLAVWIGSQAIDPTTPLSVPEGVKTQLSLSELWKVPEARNKTPFLWLSSTKICSKAPS